MTPLQKIKAGILTNNLALVAEGYNSICIDKILESDLPIGNNSIPMKPTSVQPIQQSISTQPVATEARVQRACRAEPFVPRPRINQWADDGTEATPGYTKRDREYDENTRNITKQSRPKYQPVRVTCAICGRLFDVNPAFVINNSYTCEGCIGGR